MAMFEKKNNEEELPETLPTHVGFIMDGNGRWAKKRGLPRTLGHVQGAKTFQTIIRYCKKIGIQYASFYVFSTENWKRSKDEIEGIMNILREYLVDVQAHLNEGARFIFLGDKNAFAEDIRKSMIKLEEDTADQKQITVLLACNYGGRDEITRAARQVAALVQSGEMKLEDITEQTLADHLYTGGMPDVDLVIRPSGELRLSNYLIWQCAYAEYYFTNVLWPDFNEKELNKALIDFSKRGRRFGAAE